VDPKEPDEPVFVHSARLRGLRPDREYFYVATVRHEALPVRAGCETPPPGCRGSPMELRTA
jgi:hypothetical protein